MFGINGLRTVEKIASMTLSVKQDHSAGSFVMKILTVMGKMIFENSYFEREASFGRKVVSTGKKMMNTDLTCGRVIIRKSIAVQ